jgi:competence protein ComGC
MKKTCGLPAFTLIEVLIDLAVILLLAAILFPVFAQARDMARRAVCVTHQKQLGQALLIYLQDYDETFPVQTVDPDGRSPFTGGISFSPADGRPDSTWMGSLRTYAVNPQVSVCPAARGKEDRLARPTAHSISSYVYNGLLGSFLREDLPPWPDPPPVATMPGVNRPAELMAFQDQGLTSSKSQPAPRWNPYQSRLWCDAVSGDFLSSLHTDRFIMVFLDGHTKIVPFEAAIRNLSDYDKKHLRFCLGSSWTSPRAQDRDSYYNPYK